MNWWRELPFVKILLAFTVGILLQLLTGFHFSEIEVMVAVSIIVLFNYAIRKKWLRPYRYISWAGASMQCCLLMLGNLLAFNAIDLHSADHYFQFLPQSDYMLVRINDLPLENEKTIKATVDVMSVSLNGNLKSTCGKAIVYFKKDSLTPRLNYGDELVVKNNFQPIAPPKNPDEFDYRHYAAMQNIYATAFLKRDEYKLLSVSKTNFVFQLTYWLKQKSLDAIERYITTQREAAVTEAMVIGDRDNLSFDTQQSFTDAGVIHIIVVAGLHVGILYFILEKVFFFLNRRKKGRALKSVLIILLIWMFAFLTGLSGPVLRAAGMFSLIALGKSVRRTHNIFNVLAASAFLLLFFNPLFITQAGFQLSYAAVFGINAISPYINRWLYRTNKIVNYIWKIVAASSSAQLAVLPLTLHYFNQFPVYFLLANIVVIPIAFLVVLLGMSLITLQFIPPVAMVIGKITQCVVWVLNEFILSVQQLPLSVIHLAEFNWMQVMVMTLLLIFLIQFFISKRKTFLIGSLSMALVLILLSDFNYWYNNSRKNFIVYSLKRKGLFEFTDNGKVFSFKPEEALDSREQFYFKHRRQLHDQVTAAVVNLADLPNAEEMKFSGILCCKKGIVQFHHFKLAVVNQEMIKNYSPQKLKVDAVLVSGNPKLNVKNLLSWFETKEIIFDSSNSIYKVRRWKEDAESLHAKYFDVQSQGAYVANL